MGANGHRETTPDHRSAFTGPILSICPRGTSGEMAKPTIEQSRPSTTV
jgi:hypothetical protein